ncbi:MAG: hypothetical protein N2489_07995 [Clostridia bacterium]|nr:hypothetical protein [Clostridia bacterium]
MKKVYIILPILLVIILICFFIYRENSFSFALIKSGFKTSDIDIIEHGFDNNKDEFKVLKTSTDKEKVVLVKMTKSNLGIWSVSDIQKDANKGVVSIAWFGDGGVKRYEPTENPIFFTETHYVYYGTNASKLIEFFPNQIPENVTLSVQQAGKIFCIHLLSRGDPEQLSKIDIVKLLIKNKCIANN